MQKSLLVWLGKELLTRNRKQGSELYLAKFALLTKTSYTIKSYSSITTIRSKSGSNIESQSVKWSKMPKSSTKQTAKFLSQTDPNSSIDNESSQLHSPIIDEIVIEMKNTINNKIQGLSASELEGFLNVALKSCDRYKNLPASEKSKIRNSLVSALDNNYNLLASSMAKIKATKYEKQSTNVLNLLFKFLIFCFSQNLHSPKLYSSMVRPLITPGTVFQYHSTKRLPIALMFISVYEKDFDSSPIYLNLMNYFQQPEHFNRVMDKANKDDILHIIEGLTSTGGVNDTLKLLFSKQILKKLEAQIFSDKDLIPLLCSLCKAKILEKDNFDFLLLEERAMSINLKEFNQNEIFKVLINLRMLDSYSKRLYTKIINFLTQIPEIITEPVLNLLLKNFEEATTYPNFLMFLNNFMENSYQEKKFSLSTLACFIYQLTKKMALDLDLFRQLHVYIETNATHHQWNTRDLHYIFWSCISLGFNDSSLFKLLELQTQNSLDSQRINSGEFSTLVWDVSQGNFIPDFELLKTILRRMREEAKLRTNKEVLELATLLYSVSLLIVKYRVLDEKNYEDTYKKHIQSELQHIVPSVCSWLNSKRILTENEETQVKIFQFMFTLQFEFPEILAECYIGREIIKQFESKPFQPRTISSSLSIDVETALKNLKMDFEVEHRAYIYFIDIFIKPNIAVQIEGVKHYTRDTNQQRHRDLLRDFHLTKMGYRVVKIPYFDVRKTFFTEVEKRNESIKNAIFNTQ